MTPLLWSMLVAATARTAAAAAAQAATGAQQQARATVHSESFGYARLGHGRVVGAEGSGKPLIGFGYRAELDSFALDVSFLNQQLPVASATFDTTGTSAGSLLKLEGLYFTNPGRNASAYFGGGLSWGVTSSRSGRTVSSSSEYSYSSWSGSGLQGELTAGYELPRASALRFFVQADATLPFYRTTGTVTTYAQSRSSTLTLGHRYNPSIALSLGVGWQRHRQ
jgi:hypothetical protein